MRVFFVTFLLFLMQSCASKKYTKIRLLPEGIKAATEDVYVEINDQKKLLYKKEMLFTKKGRIQYSKTVDSLGHILQETEKRLWFIAEYYPDKEPYYCKTRWKPKNRERISCYTKKQFKQNEAIYYYNSDGTINKIEDNFETFQTQYFYYNNNELSKIIIKDKNDTLIDEILIHCEAKDKKGTCLKEIRISNATKKKEEIYLLPKYNE